MDKKNYIIAKADYLSPKLKKKIIKAIDSLNKKQRARHFLYKASDQIHSKTTFDPYGDVRKTSLTPQQVHRIATKLWNLHVFTSNLTDVKSCRHMTLKHLADNILIASDEINLSDTTDPSPLDNIIY